MAKKIVVAVILVWLVTFAGTPTPPANPKDWQPDPRCWQLEPPLSWRDINDLMWRQTCVGWCYLPDPTATAVLPVPTLAIPTLSIPTLPPAVTSTPDPNATKTPTPTPTPTLTPTPTFTPTPQPPGADWYKINLNIDVSSLMYDGSGWDDTERLVTIPPGWLALTFNLSGASTCTANIRWSDDNDPDLFRYGGKIDAGGYYCVHKNGDDTSDSCEAAAARGLIGVPYSTVEPNPFLTTSDDVRESWVRTRIGWGASCPKGQKLTAAIVSAIYYGVDPYAATPTPTPTATATPLSDAFPPLCALPPHTNPPVVRCPDGDILSCFDIPVEPGACFALLPPLAVDIPSVTIGSFTIPNVTLGLPDVQVCPMYVSLPTIQVFNFTFNLNALASFVVAIAIARIVFRQTGG